MIQTRKLILRRCQGPKGSGFARQIAQRHAPVAKDAPRRRAFDDQLEVGMTQVGLDAMRPPSAATIGWKRGDNSLRSMARRRPLVMTSRWRACSCRPSLKNDQPSRPFSLTACMAVSA